jgi:hypothetical protein
VPEYARLVSCISPSTSDFIGVGVRHINPNAGLRYGEFRLPDFTIIFPENLASGNPAVMDNFGSLYFLQR